jgi:hypothetical protein
LSFVAVLACGTIEPKPDPCATETCQCTVATVDADCGAHSVCDVSGPGRVCACIDAYAKVGAGVCAFAGAPADPGFVDATKWTASMNSLVNAAGPGSADPGQAEFAAQAICGLESLRQTFKMPPYDRAEPLKVSVTHKLVDSFPNNLVAPVVQIGVAGSWANLAPSLNAFRTDTFCLGPRAYGGPIEFAISARAIAGPSCTGASRLIVDRFEVQRATPDECPLVGTVANGNFEGAAGWSLPTGTAVSGALTAGTGENGTRGAKITTTTICGQGPLVGQVTLPVDTARKALDVFWSAPSGSQVQVLLDNHAIGTVLGTGAGLHSRFCIPGWAAGTSPKLSILMLAQSDGLSTCTAMTRDLVVDNVAVTDELACVGGTPLVDPGLENTGVAPGWGLAHAYVNGGRTGEADAVRSLNFSHTGNGALATRAGNGCQSMDTGGADVAFVVPAAGPGAGPAFKFFAKAAATNVNTQAGAQVVSFYGGLPRQTFPIGPRLEIPETGVFVQGVLCLPSNWAGRLVDVRLSNGRTNGGGCGEVFSESAYFDDMEVGTDGSCPP